MTDYPIRRRRDEVTSESILGSLFDVAFFHDCPTLPATKSALLKAGHKAGKQCDALALRIYQHNRAERHEIWKKVYKDIEDCDLDLVRKEDATEETGRATLERPKATRMIRLSREEVLKRLQADEARLSDEVDDLETELREARQALRDAHKDVVESLNKRKRMTRKEEG